MTEAKPTPGTWIAETISSFVCDSDNGIYYTEGEIANVVARGPYGVITLAEEVDLADARLIAAAPELMAVVERLIDGPHDAEAIADLLPDARAAARKAKGGRA